MKRTYLIRLSRSDKKSLLEAAKIIKSYGTVRNVKYLEGVLNYNLKVEIEAETMEEILDTERKIEQELLRTNLISSTLPLSIGWYDKEVEL